MKRNGPRPGGGGFRGEQWRRCTIKKNHKLEKYAEVSLLFLEFYDWNMVKKFDLRFPVSPSFVPAWNFLFPFTLARISNKIRATGSNRNVYLIKLEIARFLEKK